MTKFDKWDANQGDRAIQSDHFRVHDSSPTLSSPHKVHLEALREVVVSQ